MTDEANRLLLDIWFPDAKKCRAFLTYFMEVDKVTLTLDDEEPTTPTIHLRGIKGVSDEGNPQFHVADNGWEVK